MNVGALAMFAFVSSITPGPNNLMLWASGMNYGVRGTARHIAGVNLGFSSLLLVTALGVGSIFDRVSWLSPVLRVAGSAYLLYLAWRIATAGRPSTDPAAGDGAGDQAGDGSGRPLTFLEAAAFQYINPKAWVMGITAAGTFLPPDVPAWLGALALTGVFGVINLPCILTWVAAGNGVGRILTGGRGRRIVNLTLAALLVGTVYLINT